MGDVEGEPRPGTIAPGGRAGEAHSSPVALVVAALE